MSGENKRSRRSTLWAFFTPVSNSDHMAQCDICKQKLSYKASVTNLKSHITRKHPTVNLQIPATIPNIDNFDPDDPVVSNATCNSQLQPSPTVSSAATTQTLLENKTHSALQQSSISSFMPKKITFSHKKKLDSILLQLFTLDYQPFSIVEDRGFTRFLRALNPGYQLPNRKTISSTLIPAAYEQCLTSVKASIASSVSLCLTTDSWTSKNNDSYLAVTAHYITDDFVLKTVLLDCSVLNASHTSVNLAAKIKSITDAFQVSEKVVIAITDNAANIKNAITSELQWKHFGCYAHTLNLIVQQSLKEVEELKEKVKHIVGHFRRSSNANSKLLDYQRQRGMVPKKLIQEVPTRWNSTYYMLQRFVEVKDAVKVTTALISADLPIITEQEWQICSDLCTVLKPFEEVTKALSGEKYITGSEAIPLTRVLSASCKRMMKLNFSDTARSVLKVLDAELSARFENIERSRTLSLCTFLDPRFKMPSFSDNNCAEAAKRQALELCTRKLSEQMSQTRQQQPPANPSETKSGCSVWDELDRILATSLPQGTATSGAILEIQRYIQEPYYPRNADPLLWWRTNQHNYPTLSKVAREKLCTVASSVPCERVFSKAGAIVSEKRTRLSTKHVGELLFLNSNYDHS